VCSQAKANAHKRIEDAQQRQRHLATQLSEKKALRNSLIESKLRGELKQEESRDMADMIAHDIEGIEARSGRSWLRQRPLCN